MDCKTIQSSNNLVNLKRLLDLLKVQFVAFLLGSLLGLCHRELPFSVRIDTVGVLVSIPLIRKILSDLHSTY